MVLSDIREDRRKRGWTQQRLAMESGLSLPTVISAELGRNVSLETAVKLQASLGERYGPESSLTAWERHLDACETCMIPKGREGLCRDGSALLWNWLGSQIATKSHNSR